MHINHAVSVEDLSAEVMALQFNTKNQMTFDELLNLACSKYANN